MAPDTTRMAPGPQTPADMHAFAQALDALGETTRQQLGDADARYIKRLLYSIRALESAGRALLTFGGAWLPTWWLGAGLLGLSKCLENMEFGHNVIHGQYDWMNDPRFEGKHHDWDNACSKEDWRHFHNYMHHHYTNVLGVDRDFGYGMLRLSNDTPWERRNFTQTLYAVVVALAFEWAIAIHNMEVDRLRTDREATKARIKAIWPTTRAKMWRQIKKDYLLWPLLGGVVGWMLGHGFWAMLGASLTGHLLANLIRNLWTFVVIFCGHFTDQVHVFDPASVPHESKGHWYLRQALGSANIQGGTFFHLMTGNLSHQIEHHLYPDLPARRYKDMAPQVKAIFKQYGVPYNTGGMTKQLATVGWRILRHNFPGGQKILSQLPASEQQLPSQFKAS